MDSVMLRSLEMDRMQRMLCRCRRMEKRPTVAFLSPLHYRLDQNFAEKPVANIYVL